MVQGSVLTHLKALLCDYLEPGGQGYGSTCGVCHAPLKNAVLLNKMAIVCNKKFLAVHTGLGLCIGTANRGYCEAFIKDIKK